MMTLIYGKGVKKGLPAANIYQAHVAKKAKAIFELRQMLLDQLASFELSHLFESVELPLAYVLADMEYKGIKVDLEELAVQKANLKARIDVLEKDIF